VNRPHPPIAVLLCSALLVLPGCSFWAVRGPDSRVRGGGECTTSPVAPVVDGIFAAAALGTGIAAVGTQSCDPRAPSSGSFGPCFIDLSGAAHGAGAGLMAVSVIEAVATTYGAVKVAACRKAKELEVPVRQPPPR
jgi:hypothetical protein